MKKHYGTLPEYCKEKGYNYRSIYPRVRYYVKDLVKLNEKTYLYNWDELDKILDKQNKELESQNKK